MATDIVGEPSISSGHWENSAGGWVLIAPVWDKPPATNQPTSYQPATNQLFHVKIAGKFQDFQIAIWWFSSTTQVPPRRPACCVMQRPGLHGMGQIKTHPTNLSIWWTESRLAGIRKINLTMESTCPYNLWLAASDMFLSSSIWDGCLIFAGQVVQGNLSKGSEKWMLEISRCFPRAVAD